MNRKPHASGRQPLVIDSVDLSWGQEPLGVSRIDPELEGRRQEVVSKAIPRRSKLARIATQEETASKNICRTVPRFLDYADYTLDVATRGRS